MAFGKCFDNKTAEEAKLCDSTFVLNLGLTTNPVTVTCDSTGEDSTVFEGMADAVIHDELLYVEDSLC